MKYFKLKKIIRVAVISLMTSLSLMFYLPQALATGTQQPTAKHEKNQNLIKQASTGRQVVKEAADAFKATEAALIALQNNQSKQALAALEVASGNLHLLLTRDPSLGMVPIDVQVQVIEGIHDLKTIKKLQDELEDLIDDDRFQAARPIVDSLVDEIRVTTISLPLATYPTAIDLIAPLIDAGKLDEAKQALINVLNTFVVEEDVTPLSIIRAEEKLDEAFQIEHTQDLKKESVRDQIEKLANEAKQEIEVAETLGYGSKDDFEVLYDGVNALKKTIGRSGFKGEWHKLKKSLSNFKNRIVHPAG
ncbi:MAG TPA: YfdX family protein [Crenotrichaceae bacterium]|nr:YfdX family protein [Crenotrichaceae bacterium]